MVPFPDQSCHPHPNRVEPKFPALAGKFALLKSSSSASLSLKSTNHCLKVGSLIFNAELMILQVSGSGRSGFFPFLSPSPSPSL